MRQLLVEEVCRQNATRPQEGFLMKKFLSLVAFGVLGACTATAQTASSGQAGASAAASSSRSAASSLAGENSINLPAGTKINASLATSLDAKRSKAGDDVEVRTEEDIKQDGRIVLKKGTHLVGHVALTQARANGQTQSQLGIVFDYAVLKNGRQVPFSASIQALASAQAAKANPTGADDRITAAGGMGAERGTVRSSLVGGAASTADATAGAATGAMMNAASSTAVNAGGSLDAGTRSSGAVRGLTSAGRLAANSSGVFGLDGVSIDTAASTATQGSMIISGVKNVHLDSGTHLLLRTNARAQ
jgi:hypothetical protein